MAARRSRHPMSAAGPAARVSLRLDGRWLIAELGGPHRVASWAPARGGLTVAERVVWHQVVEGELPIEVDAEALLAARLEERGLSDAVGLLTGRRLDRFVCVESGPVTCVATVGLANALRAGDPPGPAPAGAGTINILVHVDRCLSDGAFLETVSVAAEARTVAMVEAGVPSRRTGRPATGTGTDCIVVAAPLGAGLPYAGKHTDIGASVGKAVIDAVADGARAWRRDWGPS